MTAGEHDRAYSEAIRLVAFAHDVAARFPRTHSELAARMSGASTSIVLDIAEGGGKVSKLDGRRHYARAIDSTTECAAVIDLCFGLRLVPPEARQSATAMLEQIAAALVKLVFDGR